MRAVLTAPLCAKPWRHKLSSYRKFAFPHAAAFESAGEGVPEGCVACPPGGHSRGLRLDAQSSAARALDRVAINNSGSRAMPRQRSGAPHPTCEAFRLMGAPARERAGLSCRIAATARAARTHHGPRRKAAAAFSQGSRLPTRGVRTALSGSAANGG